MSLEIPRAVIKTGSRASRSHHAARAIGKQSFSTSMKKKSSVAATKASAETIESHLVSLVQTADYPNYLSVAQSTYWHILLTDYTRSNSSCTSFYPSRDARYDYLAVRAFNIEVSSIADNVTNPQIAKLRYQWWRDAVASINSVSCALLHRSPHAQIYQVRTNRTRQCRIQLSSPCIELSDGENSPPID